MDDVHGRQSDQEISSDLFEERLRHALEPFLRLAGAAQVVRLSGRFLMKKIFLLFVSSCWFAFAAWTTTLSAQDAKPAQDSQSKPAAATEQDSKRYSGMYTFLKEGEFVQVTIEDAGHVSGFISRFGDGESDKGAFLDQFFKNGKLDGDQLIFSTELVHGVSFDFKGKFERGDGKNPGDDSYFVLKGTLTENESDASKKVTSHARDVVFKLFPEDAAPSAAARK